jgi:hypothetical protein
MSSTNLSSDWQSLGSPAQIKALLGLFGDFHDACVREIHVATGHYVKQDLAMTCDWRTTVHVLIQRQFAGPSAVELRFEEVVGLRVCPPGPNHDSVLFDAALFLRDGIVYWADRDGWTPEVSDRDDSTWVSARKAYWRDASEWLGPQLRYRQELT